MEYYTVMDIQYSWRRDGVHREPNEDEQDFCWRVRRFTRNALLTMAREMSNHSALAYAIILNHRDHSYHLYQINRNRPQVRTEIKQGAYKRVIYVLKVYHFFLFQSQLIPKH
jgi:hypothetical protein